MTHRSRIGLSLVLCALLSSGPALPAFAAKVCVLCTLSKSPSSKVVCYGSRSCACAQKYGKAYIKVLPGEVYTALAQGLAGSVMLNEAWHIDQFRLTSFMMGCVNTNIPTP